MRTFLPRFAACGIFLTSSLAAQVAVAPPATPVLPPNPAPAFIGKLTLVRYDTPVPFSSGYAPTRQAAKIKDGPDAVVWPEFTLNGKPVFRGGKSEEDLPLKLRTGAEAASPFQLPTDEVLQPGNHWLRAMDWRIGLRHLYTADRTARTANAAGAMFGHYELWLFPVILQGDGGPVVKNVELKVGGVSILKHASACRSLTLLLPQNEPARPYVLTVDGRPPVTFSAGLQPVKLGRPNDALIPISATIAGNGPKIFVRHLSRPAEFPYAKEWAADEAALKKPLPATLPFDRGRSLKRYVGAETPA